MIERYIKPGTQYKLSDGIYRIMEESFESRAAKFTDAYARIRLSENADQEYDYEHLPFGVQGTNRFIWKIREHGLGIVKNLLPGSDKADVLEVSTYNGWLTHHLHNWGHRVVTMDIFPDEAYGLKSKAYYKNHDWLSIQCDIENVDFLQPVFDVVIINHCIQFFTSPLKVIEQYKKWLRPNGTLIILGIYIFNDPHSKQKAAAKFIEYYSEKYDFNIFLNPNKGYLDAADRMGINKAGIVLHYYPSLIIRSMAAVLFPQKPRYYYGLWKARAE